MSFYALGTTSDKQRAEVLRLCRQHSEEAVQTLSARIGSGEVLVGWSSRSTPGQDKDSVIANIGSAVAAFEALGVPVTYFYRVTTDQPWERVEQHVFRNILSSDLQTWHTILSQNDSQEG